MAYRARMVDESESVASEPSSTSEPAEPASAVQDVPATRVRPGDRDPAPAIAADRYAGDLALLDRYQRFSEEIARLSLAGIAGIGFFVEKLDLGASRNAVLPVWLALACFAVGIVGALWHRYWSSDGFAYHLSAARLHERDDGGGRVAEDRKMRNALYARSARGIGVAVVGFVLGSLALAVAFGLLLAR